MKEYQVEAVKVTVSGFANAYKQFTSVDITNAVKECGIWVRNRDVAEWLREDQAKNGRDWYKADQISVVVKGNSVRATLYSPLGYRPDHYESTDLLPLSPREVREIADVRIEQTMQNLEELLAEREDIPE